MTNGFSRLALSVVTVVALGCGEEGDPPVVGQEDGSVNVFIPPPPVDAAWTPSTDAGTTPPPPPFDSGVSPSPGAEAGVSSGRDSGSIFGPRDAGSGSGDSSAEPLQPVGSAPTKLPTATGTCPEFSSGDATFTPTGVPSRKVRLWVGSGTGGPLVFYWHGTGSAPTEASSGFSTGISAVTGLGGVVAALYTGSSEGTFPWLTTYDEALKIADEVVACAITKKQINISRIHTLGMSAGGLMAAQTGMRRSNYMASITAYSGGASGVPTPIQDTANKFAALLFNGGPNDVVAGLNFKTASDTYSGQLKKNGNFTVLCDHGGGHRIPAGGAAAAWKFFQDHPYGTNPSPYVAAGLPSALPMYCMPVAP